jgi:branched-chain amino acid transport system ATP-binding protein
MPTSDMNEPVLQIRGLEVGYGKHQILRGVDLEVSGREVVAVLGANGVGKTTLLNAISGFLKPSGGEIVFRGARITGAAPHQTFQQGIVQVSQSRDLFPDMTVEDNLRLGAAGAGQPGDTDADLQNVFASFPRLRERRNQHTRTLSGGEQQMVAIGRAVMGRPRILMLDEPSGGLSPQFVAEIGAIGEGLKKNGATMLLVEQNIALARRLADRFLILRDGRVADTISADAFANPDDDALKRIYL